MGCDEEDEEDGDFEGEDETVEEEEEEEEEEEDDDDIVLTLPVRWRVVICLFEEPIDPADSAPSAASRTRGCLFEET